MKVASKPQSSGAFANNLRDFDSLRDFFTSAILSSIVDLPFLAIFLALIGYLGGNLVLVPIVTLVIVIVVSLVLRKPMKKSVEHSKIGAAQKHAMLSESINNIETIKTTATESSFLAKWESNVKQVAKSKHQFRLYSSLISNLTISIQQVSTVALVVAGVFMVEAGALTIGGLLACIILNSRALAPLSAITNIISRFELSKLALLNLNQIMAEPQERPEGAQFLSRHKIKGDIAFSRVSFSYPSQAKNALTDFNLKIKHGERIAIVGKIGAGKSTFTKMCLGLYQSNEGDVFIDGANILQIDPADLRANMGYCSQDSRLFYGTIRENIVLGRECTDDQIILDLGKDFGLDKILNNHPSGYDLQVGEMGGTLSYGQRQSICLVRALLPDPSILILDEPTSSMDQGTEALIVNGLKKHIENKTLIITTHRRSLMALVDRVVVIDNGVVTMDGSKEDILKNIDKI